MNTNYSVGMKTCKYKHARDLHILNSINVSQDNHLRVKYIENITQPVKQCNLK